MPTNPEIWQKRQEAIRDLLSGRPVASQTELLKKLAKRGFHATQSSVSRDLREMHVAKADGKYVLPEALAAGVEDTAQPAPETFGAIRDVQPAGPNVLVVHTPPGIASAIGLAIDTAHWPDVVGTVAGDDTLFVATQNRTSQARVAARLMDLKERQAS
jgi:transcriptional regulator of arginine metabolism